MPVLPKYQLKALFEAGDLITQTTLNEFIDASYNPTLVAGSNVTLTTVSTASGDTITISSTGGGGGGSPIIAGDGIEITTVGSDEQIAIDLDTSQTNLIFNGSKELTFAGTHVQQEGSVVGTYKTFNFIGVDVLAEDSGTPGKVNVYVPRPSFASHFNTTDGTTNGIVSESGFTRNNVRISSPTDEALGTPFKTSGWAGTTQSAYNNTTTATNTFTTAQEVTGFSLDASGDATITVTVYDANGVDVLKTFTTPVIFANGNYSNTDNDITVGITSFATDTSKNKAKVTVTAIMADIFSDAGRSGGRYFIRTVMNTDTVSDGAGTYTYTQTSVFWDINDLGGYPSTPAINGTVSIVESSTPANIITKHLSGVEYYTTNSEFMIDVTDIDNLNSNTQGRTGSDGYNFLATGSDYGLATPIQVKAWSPTSGTFIGWANEFNTLNINYDRDDWDVTANNWRFRNSDGQITSQVFDPWNSSSIETSVGKPILVDTYGITSDDLTERFDDENQRLERTGSYTAFNSSVTLTGSGLANQTTSSLTSGPFCQAAVVGGSIVRPDKFYADNGNSPQTASIIANLSQVANPYKPNKGGTNPNYSTASYQVSSTFHRLFEASVSNQSRPISSFEITFSGSFPGASAYASLNSNDLRIYVRKLAAASSTNIGYAATPHSLHNTGTFSGSYQDPPTAIDDNTTSQCRTTTTASNIIAGSFGSSPALNGFYVEVQIHNSAIKIDGMSAKLIFSSGTPTTESGGSV
tara:strand:+ start:385 stop:2634 length:2250 start_codon:yes stop_codon:yes gene_type:complete